MGCDREVELMRKGYYGVVVRCQREEWCGGIVVL
jgi:hypothetical protein